MQLKCNAKQLRIGVKLINRKALSRNEIYIVLDNVLDTYNIGSIFRLADAVAAQEVILCKGSLTPPNNRIKTASINTTEVVEWRYFDQTEDAITHLRGVVPGLQVIAVEQAKGSVPYDRFDYHLPVALIVGHETDGVSAEVLEMCDAIVELPMFGVNISLNVMVSLGIVLYQVLTRQRKAIE